MNWQAWMDRRRRKVAAWCGARLRSLPANGESRVAIFCDCEGHFGGPIGEAHAEAGLAALLGMLKRLDLRITFNLVAELCDTHRDRVERIKADGHEIACHGFQHERADTLDEVALDEMLRKAKAAFANIGVVPRGFRSPQSAWSMRLMRRLSHHGFRWSAERDSATVPYRLRRSLVRVPVSTDDWDVVDGTRSAESLIARWNERVDAAYRGGEFIALGVHEWVVAATPGFEHGLADFLARVRAFAPIVTLSEAAQATHSD